MEEKQPMVDWYKAIQEIDLVDFFRYRMPNFFYDNKRKAFVDNSDSTLRSDKFEFFKGKDGNQNYISRATGNAGNLIHFIKNHVVQNEPNVWKAVNKELVNYNSNLAIIKQEIKEREYIQNFNRDSSKELFSNSMTEEFLLKGEFLPLHSHQRNYMTDFRQLSNETIDHPLFKGIVKSYKDEKENFFTIAYEIKDINNKVVGVQKTNTNPAYDNFNSKRFARGSQNDVGFVFSNPIGVDKDLQVNSKQGGRNLIITESLWDAMSHFEVNQPQNSEYLSTNGELSENKAFKLKQFFDLRAFEKITLSTDNDIRGCFFDTIIISKMVPEIKINYKDKDFLSISLTINDKENFVKAEKLSTKFREIDKKTLDFFNGVMPRNMAVDIINQEKAISYLKRNSKSEIEFIVPNTKEYLETFNNMSLQIFPGINKKITIHKSNSKDWNEDLKIKKQENLDLQQELPKKKGLKI